MSHYEYYQPESLDEAIQLKNTIPESLYISGGTDLMVRIKKREIRPRALVSLRSIPDLSGVKNGKIIRIGSMTSISEVSKNHVLHKKFPVLIQAALALGSVQIRNVATIGGNLCNGSPAADMALPLLVLEAKVKLQDAKKTRELPIDDFFKGPGETILAPGEILTDILLEPPDQNIHSIFIKKGRTKMDLAVASVASLIQVEVNRCSRARIAVGSVAPTPVRLFEVESLLEGATLSPGILAKTQTLATKSVAPITDVRSTSDYRRHLIGVLVRRSIERLLGKEFRNKEFGDRY